MATRRATGASPSSRRRFRRTSVLLTGRLFRDGEAIDCLVTNLSAGGARIRTLDQTKSAMQPSDNAPTSLLIERYGRLRSKLMWTEGDNVGVRFLHNPKAVRTFLGPSLAGNSAAAAA